MENLIKRVLEDQWDSIQTDIEKLAAQKVKEKIEEKKLDILAKLNDVDVEKMKEMISEY